MSTLLVFLKAPAPGKVKTRLARAIGDEAAVKAYREMVAAIRDEIRGLEGVRTRWVYQPFPPFEDLAWLGLPKEGFWPQGDGDLGQRLERGFARAFEEDGGPVCVIGTDSPGLPKKTIAEAFDRLSSTEAVVGPVDDGGYYLLGMRKFSPELLSGIEWSTENVLAQTKDRARTAGLAIEELPPYFDVDTVEDYERWRSGTAG